MTIDIQIRNKGYTGEGWQYAYTLKANNNEPLSFLNISNYALLQLEQFGEYITPRMACGKQGWFQYRYTLTNQRELIH